jgi:hypothetical protein
MQKLHSVAVPVMTFIRTLFLHNCQSCCLVWILIVLPDRDYWHLLLLLCLLTLTLAFFHAHRRRIYFAQFVNIAYRYLARTSAVSFCSVCQASALTMNNELALASIAALLLIRHCSTSRYPWILGHNNRDDYRIQWSVCGLLLQLQRCWKEHRA